MASTPPATVYEKALYVGITLQNVLYGEHRRRCLQQDGTSPSSPLPGVELVFYFRTMQIFFARRRKPHRLDAFFAAFSTVMLFLITGWIAADAVIGAKLWMLDRNFPGGPVAYLMSPAFVSYNRYEAAVTIILQQMTDGLMVWRCRVVWDSLRVIIIPCFLWLATLLFGILAAATQKTSPIIGISVKFVLVLYTISVFMSASLTCMICFRLLRHAREMKERVGAEFASPYITTAMIFVESVLPYTLTGIVFLVMTGVGVEPGIAFSRMYTLMMCISPQMLILRVAEGTAWQKDSMKPRSALVFNLHSDTSDTGPSSSDGVHQHMQPLQGVVYPESDSKKKQGNGLETVRVITSH
ncbi:hypothetical protein HD554DRAFT_2012465 [Boletus coccyginus]|nr:hypothetical protein HD554DRAFT_2012465 [Boletus coccyginus]